MHLFIPIYRDDLRKLIVSATGLFAYVASGLVIAVPTDTLRTGISSIPATCGVAETAPRTEENILCVLNSQPDIPGLLMRTWTRVLRKKPGLQGRIVFSVSVVPTGRAVATLQTDAIGDEEFARALKAIIEQTEFGKSSAGTIEAQYKVDFGI